MTHNSTEQLSASPLGSAIRELRLERGLRLAELARRVDCYPGHMKRIESGKRNPSEVLLRRIARELETDVASIRKAAA